MKAEYVDHMGNDNSVVNAARVSLAKNADLFTQAENENLIRYLARGRASKAHQALLDQLAKGVGEDEAQELLSEILSHAVHWTPFAHTSISLRVSAPVPIRTQCFKHKQGFVENEESRRYISSRPELYIPHNFRERPAGSIKQGSAGIHPRSDKWLEIYKTKCSDIIDQYEAMIQDGVCPEQARLILPQGVEVNWIWTGNLMAYANFYNKRSDSHAQKEIQILAEEVQSIIQPLFPVSWDALTHAV